MVVHYKQFQSIDSITDMSRIPSKWIHAGLKITAGHRTMSSQIRNLTGQIFYSPVMLTGHIQQSYRNKRKFPLSSVVCDELK